MPINVTKSAYLRRSAAGLWGVFAVILLSVIYLLSNMGLNSLKIITIVTMLATAAMLFNRGSRHLLIVPAVIVLLCSLIALVLQHNT
ncbi:DUF1435 family protein [Providencia vermicola]|uniref:DUF1435 family protein n=1 Tax=Providencia vermicola TaxID=333965 RepID=UPI0034D551F8